jgi:hypothetical protein
MTSQERIQRMFGHKEAKIGLDGLNPIEIKAGMDLKAIDRGVMGVFYTGVKQNKMMAYPQVDGTRPRWFLRSADAADSLIPQNAWQVAKIF